MESRFKTRENHDSGVAEITIQDSSKSRPSTGSDVEEHNSTPERPSSDMETLMKLLGNPETAALLKALAKAMDK
ncbi:MAG: hypothetical protein J6128_04845 [Clostridia bacterium]|nr:hypothetical protein [Clostridia bacterium]